MSEFAEDAEPDDEPLAAVVEDEAPPNAVTGFVVDIAYVEKSLDAFIPFPPEEPVAVDEE